MWIILRQSCKIYCDFYVFRVVDKREKKFIHINNVDNVDNLPVIEKIYPHKKVLNVTG